MKKIGKYKAPQGMNWGTTADSEDSPDKYVYGLEGNILAYPKHNRLIDISLWPVFKNI